MKLINLINLFEIILFYLLFVSKPAESEIMVLWWFRAPQDIVASKLASFDYLGPEGILEMLFGGFVFSVPCRSIPKC